MIRRPVSRLHPSPEGGGCRAKRGGWGRSSISSSARIRIDHPTRPPSLRCGGHPPPSGRDGSASPYLTQLESDAIGYQDASLLIRHPPANPPALQGLVERAGDEEPGAVDVVALAQELVVIGEHVARIGDQRQPGR